MKIKVVKDTNGNVLGTYDAEELNGEMELQEGDYIEEHEVDQSDVDDLDRLYGEVKKPGRRISTS